MDTTEATGRTGMLTAQFDAAVRYALTAHDKQKRQGTSTPYAAHLLGVAALVLEAGGSEAEAIAALLHDVVEDQGGAQRLADVRSRFGDDVAAVVLECSAEDKSDGATWRDRKARYVDGIATMSASALLVSLADKVYNARAMLDDYRMIGNDVWRRFGADEPKGQSVRWYYDQLIRAYEGCGNAPRPLLAELTRTVIQLAVLTGRPNCPECGAGDVGLIAYGMPDPNYLDAWAEEDVEVGGCVITQDSPDFRCRRCGAGWVREGRSW